VNYRWHAFASSITDKLAEQHRQQEAVDVLKPLPHTPTGTHMGGHAVCGSDNMLTTEASCLNAIRQDKDLLSSWSDAHARKDPMHPVSNHDFENIKTSVQMKIADDYKVLGAIRREKAQRNQVAPILSWR
jgi:hypothetical protein